MTHAPEIDDLMEKVRAALETAFRRGVAASAKDTESVKKSVLDALGIQISNSQGDQGKKAAFKAKKPESKGRAQRGAVGLALEAVFKDGMTTKEVQQAVTALDATVNPKSVYNELWKDKTPYEQRDDKWYAKPGDSPQSSETVSPPAGSPAPSPTTLAAAVAAPQPLAATPVAPTPTPSLPQSANTPVSPTPVAPAAVPSPAQSATAAVAPSAATSTLASAVAATPTPITGVTPVRIG